MEGKGKEGHEETGDSNEGKRRTDKPNEGKGRAGGGNRRRRNKELNRGDGEQARAGEAMGS